MKGFWFVLIALLAMAVGLAMGPPTAEAQVCPDPPANNEDCFEDSRAVVTIVTPFGPTTVNLKGPTTVWVQLENPADDDPIPPDPPNGLDEVQTEIVDMALTGYGFIGATFCRVEVRAGDIYGLPESLGWIEESPPGVPGNGRLDLPGRDHIAPFCWDDSGPPQGCLGKTAESWFDVFFEIELSDPADTDLPYGDCPGFSSPWRKFHNDTDHPHTMRATIVFRPPDAGKTYVLYPPGTNIPLLNENGDDPGMWIDSSSHTPNVHGPRGGTVELLVGSPDSPASPADGSGTSIPYAALAGAAAAAAAALAAGAWYVRRRRVS